MSKQLFEVESSTPFAESIIWQLNRDYYNDAGIAAWSEGIVPHQMTSNAQVGKTYAALIFGFLKDLAAKGQKKETVYLLELGAGHGRLAFHILKHLEKLIQLQNLDLPPYCYVLSDIVAENLAFFYEHPQFQSYLEKGILEVAYFDAINSTEIYLQYAKKTISPQDLQQPLLAIANYFFDSLPTDLFLVKNKTISSCSVTLQSTEDPKTTNAKTLLKNLKANYQRQLLTAPFYKETALNDILEYYKRSFQETYIFFPNKAFECLENLRKLSRKGLAVITMDKGFCEARDLARKGEPEIIIHGSFSIWVNYHALGAFCHKQGGKVLYPSAADFYLQVGCLLFLPDSASYTQTNAAYEQHINDFGPDDFNGIKRLTYHTIAQLNLQEIIALIRLSSYDSTFFINVLPRLKQLVKRISMKERERFAETMHHTWDMYFYINEPFDLAYELGGLFYDLGFYTEALLYFEHSNTLFGKKADNYYNQALCYYQLREDELFVKFVKEAKLIFPTYEKIAQLGQLDLGSV